MKRLLTLAAALVASLTLAACGQEAAPPGTTVLSYASPYPPGHPFSRADADWIAYVTKASGGRLRIRPYWAGALISSEMSMEEVRHGVADIGLITPIYARGGAHVQRAQAGFYGGVETINGQVAVYKCLAAQFPELRNEIHGLHVLAVQGGNFLGVITRSRPVTKLADLRGLRLRAPSENLDVLRALGADPVNMPMGEVYSALAKGVIDGVVAPADTLKSLHFAEVAPHYAALRFSRGAYPARAISEQRWQALPAELRAVMTKGQAVWESALTRELTKAEADGIAFGKSHGVSFTQVSPQDQQAFDILYNRNGVNAAKALARFGADATPIFHEAQALIARSQGGAAPACSAAEPKDVP
jgi:TRAP-type C4-dicarboxylate transport system substrate-binding protein